jgi:hypothetical protein
LYGQTPYNHHSLDHMKVNFHAMLTRGDCQ